MIDVSELMSDPELTTSFVIQRPSNTFDSTNSGQVQREYVRLNKIGIVQPAEPRQIQTLDEGIRSGEIIAVWCSDEVAVSDGAGILSDLVLYEGGTYQAVKCERWGDSGYFMTLAKRISL